MRRIHWTDLIIAVVLAELTGTLSALFSGSYINYESIAKPPFSPPAVLFPIVWGILYAFMGISSYIIYHSDSRGRINALRIYILQLIVNFSWSIFFFRFRLFRFSAAIAIILAILVGIMVYKFIKIRKSAGFINIPYLAWSIFAAYLATGTALLN